MLIAAALAWASCSPALRVVHPAAENSPPRNGEGLRLILSAEMAPDYASPFTTEGGEVRKRRKLTADGVGVWAFQGLWRGEYQAHLQYYDLGRSGYDWDDGQDRSDGKGGRFGLTKTVWQRKPFAASAGFKASFLKASYRDERADSQLVELPLLIGTRGTVKNPAGRWIVLSGHAYTGIKLLAGAESLWIGNPRVRRTQPIYAVQGPLAGVGFSFLFGYVNFEVSPVLALLPVTDTSFSLAFPAFGISIEFEPEEEPLSDQKRPGDEPRSEGG